MKKKFIAILLTAFIGLILSLPAYAQSESDYSLSIDKIMGYSGFGRDIQGTFAVRLNGPKDAVSEISFFMDGAEMGKLNTAPYKLTFVTDSYPVGLHQISAHITLKDGKQLEVRPISVKILSGEAAMAKTLTIVIRIVAIVAAVSVFGVLASRSRQNFEPGKKQSYSRLWGGTVCPNCGHPFPRSPFGINLGFKRMERCPACKKWVGSTRATSEALEAAEQAEAIKYGKAAEDSLNSGLLKESANYDIEDSKYIDGV